MTDYEFACELVELARQALRDAVLAASTSDGRGSHERQQIDKLKKVLNSAMRERDALSPNSEQRKKTGRNEYQIVLD